jgi:hypothetical protein
MLHTKTACEWKGVWRGVQQQLRRFFLLSIIRLSVDSEQHTLPSALLQIGASKLPGAIIATGNLSVHRSYHHRLPFHKLDTHTRTSLVKMALCSTREPTKELLLVGC